MIKQKLKRCNLQDEEHATEGSGYAKGGLVKSGSPKHAKKIWR
jgi:hypothetical protein